jgi:5-formyltetrahydrofolate cyclo-ligase
MGGGYYDRSFAFRKHASAAALLVGVGYALQESADSRPQAMGRADGLPWPPNPN